MTQILTLREQFAEWYLDYVNNFITVDGFAQYYGLSHDQATKVIALGKELHETPHPES